MTLGAIRGEEAEVVNWVGTEDAEDAIKDDVGW